jgi:hypothetical protein
MNFPNVLPHDISSRDEHAAGHTANSRENHR